jgi:hypothetical protein
MKRTFRAIIATDSPDSNGMVFSKEALENIAASVPGVPLTFGFNKELVFGKVSKAETDGKSVVVSGELVDDLDMWVSMIPDLYAVPGYRKTSDGGLSMLEVSITMFPADGSLPKIDIFTKEKLDETQD